MNKSDALNTLLDLKKIFDSVSLEYWLTDGTLLGLHREGDFINHDKDIDVGIFIENWLKHPNALKLISEGGFRLDHEFGEKDCGYEISIIKRNIKIDLFFFYKGPPPAR
ncbi:MAG: LicD family protein, partial [Nitrosopumilus sp.]|nr:LicD family protein [Nitrosopumilus sp.]